MIRGSNQSLCPPQFTPIGALQETVGQPTRKMIKNPEFEIVDTIGHGQFSNVFKARWRNPPESLVTQRLPPPSGARRVSLDPNLHLNRHPVCTQATQFDENYQQLTFRHQNNNAKSLESSNRHSLRSSEYLNRRQGDLNQEQQQPSPLPKYVALKKIKLFEIQNSKDRKECLEEVELLKQLKHPNIINYYRTIIQQDDFYIVLELADGGDLSKLIRYFQRKSQNINELTILKYFTQVCSAVQYIHSKRILHRDIKPANIFMTSDGCVKLGDFGLSRFFSQNTHDAHSIVGTFFYMSPERICKDGYSFSSDVWSLGCVLYELITLISPFDVSNYPNLVQYKQQQPAQIHESDLPWIIDRIIRAEYPSLDGFISISLPLRQLTTECLNPNPMARPNMTHVCAVVDEAYRLQRIRNQNQ